MSSDVIGFFALLLIAISAVALSITAVMALARPCNLESGPCQATDKLSICAPGSFTRTASITMGSVILICIMLLTVVMVIVVQHSSEIFPAGRIFSLGGVFAGLTLSVCLWRSSRQKCV